jgi:hypothetical protein
MALPQIDEINRKKPLCYDPSRQNFIYYDEILTKKEPDILPSTLAETDKKKLIVERLQKGPDFKTQSISGPLMNRNDVIKSIKNNEKYGVVFVEAEISYLDELLKQIRQYLK